LCQEEEGLLKAEAEMYWRSQHRCAALRNSL
jgi:hypothetical protein